MTTAKQRRGTGAHDAHERASLRSAVKRYYRENQFFYDRFWSDSATQSMNYGLWTRNTYRLRQAFENQDRVIADALSVGPDDVVLEAGCGQGGASVWLAQHRRSRGVGITLCRDQARRATQLAQRRGLADRVAFAVMDFTRTAFADASFTKIFASESVCYAWDKGEFIREAYRLLRPGGRLTVIDGFEPTRTLSPGERRLLSQWAAGWAVPGLAGVSEFRSQLAQAGFRDASFTEMTERIMPSARRILLRAILALPVVLLTSPLRALTASQRAHVCSSATQYFVWSRRVAIYGMVTAEKPAAGVSSALLRVTDTSAARRRLPTQPAR